MQFFGIVYALSMLSLALASTNWDIVRDMHEGNENLAIGQRVWFYELWPAKGAETDCVSGYAHVRLITGSRTGTKSRSDFKGTWFDLAAKKNGNTYEGGETSEDSGSWEGRHSNHYQWIGTTTKSDSTIKTEAGTYVHNHPVYHMAGNNAANCKTFVQAITGTNVNSAKRSLENVFEASEIVEVREDVPVRAEVFVA